MKFLNRISQRRKKANSTLQSFMRCTYVHVTIDSLCFGLLGFAMIVKCKEHYKKIRK